MFKGCGNINKNSPILTYKIQAVTATSVTAYTITVDRALPDFVNQPCLGDARALIYPSGMTPFYDAITPASYFSGVCSSADTVNVWNMNIPWSESPAGVIPTINEDYTYYGSVNYLGTKEFMSVQPMNLPSGLVFFLDFQYGQAGGKNAPFSNFGPSGDVYGATSSMYGNTNPANGAVPNGGLYGAGRFAYSINQFSQSYGVTVATASWGDVRYEAELSASAVTGGYTKVSVGLPSNADTKGVRAFILASGSDLTPATNARLLPEFTTVTGTSALNLTASFIYSGSVASADVPTAAGTHRLFYNIQPVDNNRGDFEDRSTSGFGGYPNAESTSTDSLAIPSIDIKMKSEAIVAKTRKLIFFVIINCI